MVANVKNNFVNEKTAELKNIFNSIIMDSSIDDEKKTSIIIHATSLVCGIVAAQPIPFADIFILTPIQVVMVTYLNKVIGNPFKKSKITEIVSYLLGVVGWGVLAQQMILGAYKTVVPFLGAVTTIPLVYAATYALGTGAKTILQSKVNYEDYDKEELKKIIKEAKLHAKKEANFEFSLKSMKNELEKVKNQAVSYTEYQKSLEVKDELLNNERRKIGRNEPPSISIVERYEKEVKFIQKRFKESYGKKLSINDSIFYTMTMFPTEAFEKIEYALSQLIQGNKQKISFLEVNKNEFELKVEEVGVCYLYGKNDLFVLNYLEVDSSLLEKYPIIQMTTNQTHKHIKNEEI